MNIQVQCQNCGKNFDLSYLLLGASVQCEKCKEYTVAKVPVGTHYPDTGFAISFRDFRQLLEYPDHRPHIEPLIKDWFNYSLESDEFRVKIINAKGECMDPLWLHLRIQDSTERQEILYRIAMSLWR